jgi:hypothetical protein
VTDDPNDTLVNGGPDAVRSTFDNIVALPQTRPKGIIFDGDEDIGPPPMLIKGILPETGLAFIGGQSGAGKTFVAVDMSVALSSRGATFFGRSVKKRVGVLFVAAEGRGMLASRIKAARRHRGVPEEEKLPIAWFADAPILKRDDDFRKFQALVRLTAQDMKKIFDVPLGVVIVDTLAATFNLDDEDDNSEAARVLRQLRAVGDAVEALIVPIHHFGKSESTGLRGGSAWRAGPDVVISVLATRDTASGEVKDRRIAISKARDGEEGPLSGFSLRWMELGLDRDGEPFRSCFVEPTIDGGAGTRAAAAVRAKMDQSERVFRDAFAEISDAKGTEISVRGDGPAVRAVHMSDLEDEFKRRYGTGEGDPKKRNEAARGAWRRIIKKMLARQFCVEARGNVEWIWPVS